MKAKELIDRPIIIIGCHRSGTTLLFRNLAEHPLTWSRYEESFHIYRRHHSIDPELGDRLARPPTPSEAAAITKALYDDAHNKEIFGDRRVLRFIPRKFIQKPFNRLYKKPPIRLIEKTPANALRVPYLAALFPDARFIFLVRRPEAVISSLMEGWKIWSKSRDGRWRYDTWHYLVPPGWQSWTQRRLEEICAFQYVESNRIAWQDLNEHCRDRFTLVRHEDALAQPKSVYGRLLEFCELPPSAFFYDQVSRSEKRLFLHRGSRPRSGKWKELNGPAIETVRPMFQPLADQFYPDSAIGIEVG